MQLQLVFRHKFSSRSSILVEPPKTCAGDGRRTLCYQRGCCARLNSLLGAWSLIPQESKSTASNWQFLQIPSPRRTFLLLPNSSKGSQMQRPTIKLSDLAARVGHLDSRRLATIANDLVQKNRCTFQIRTPKTTLLPSPILGYQTPKLLDTYAAARRTKKSTTTLDVILRTKIFL